MNHPFYQKKQKEQKKIQLIVCCYAFLLFIIALIIAWQSNIYFIAFFVFYLLLTIIAPFIDVPNNKKSGKLIYYSNFFIVEKEKNGVLQIHGGTLLDYYFVLNFKWNSKQRTNYIIQQYLEGLVNLIEEYEKNNVRQIRFTGTTYILNKNTAKKLGFTITKTNSLQLMLLVLNYFNVLISNSIAKGNFSFPNVTKSISFEAKLDDLVKKKASIKALSNKLKHRG
ncbi:hypothetical protein KW502_03200 [Mesonia sp. JHPTF-M18]|uniref:Uncharacterized protein n=1 Tax=Mesonia aestuariivivens TaxID=2796128 RepID=A0ABS6VZ02_9FLAO|nr:hypothetical protein [Mesonia aestuariivivens]